MNSRERVNTAMRGEQPDRAPVWCLLSLEHIIRNAFPDGTLPETVEELVAAECRLSQRYHFDGVVLYRPGARRGERVDRFIQDALHDVPHGTAEHRIAEVDPESWPREPLEVEPENFYSSHLAREILGDSYHIGGWTPDGYSSAVQWFPDLQEAMIAMAQAPERFAALVDYFDVISIAWAQAQIRQGKLESVQISSPYAGATFISPTMYRRFVLPSVRKLAQACRAQGGFSYLHTCGFIGDRLEMMAESGVDGIECMDPPPLGDLQLADAKARVGRQLFLKGNIDSVNVLLQGDDALVDRVIIETLKAGKPAGGYILSTACSVAPEVRPERVQRMAELAETYGVY